jgi:hypothetical protein
MPSIRSWEDLHLFRPDADTHFEHAAVRHPAPACHLQPQESALFRGFSAFRELGQAIRTDFLLRYLGSADLRRPIGAATNKSELFNRYAQWVALGSSGLATAATRDEQRQMVKYNHLVANLLIFQTAVSMTRALFGSYELDLSKPPAPLPFDLLAYVRPPNLAPASKAAV